jgi:hypothetical protein
LLFQGRQDVSPDRPFKIRGRNFLGSGLRSWRRYLRPRRLAAFRKSCPDFGSRPKQASPVARSLKAFYLSSQKPTLFLSTQAPGPHFCSVVSLSTHCPKRDSALHTHIVCANLNGLGRPPGGRCSPASGASRTESAIVASELRHRPLMYSRIASPSAWTSSSWYFTTSPMLTMPRSRPSSSTWECGGSAGRPLPP